MFLRPNLSISEISPKDTKGNANPLYPTDLRCKSGHTAHGCTRFFMVCGDTLAKERWGIYCEDCLKAANIYNRVRAEKRARLSNGGS